MPQASVHPLCYHYRRASLLKGAPCMTAHWTWLVLFSCGQRASPHSRCCGYCGSGAPVPCELVQLCRTNY